MWAVQEIYFQAIRRGGGQLTAEALNLVMQENEYLGQFLHMSSLEGLAERRKLIPMEKTEHIYVVEGTGIALAYLTGPIYPRANMQTAMSGATSIGQYLNDVHKAFDDEEIKGIVQVPDSPGGDVRGIGAAANQIYEMRKTGRKPIKTFVEGYNASAAYYITSTSEEIISDKDGLSGSIGVVLAGKRKGEDEFEIVSSVSPNKRPDPDDPDGKATLQTQVDDLADNFVTAVAKHRGIKKQEVLDNYGKGAAIVGPRAKKQGLVDRIGSLSQVVDEMRRASTTTRTAVGKAAGWSPSVIALLDDINYKMDSDMGLEDDEAVPAQATETERIINMAWTDIFKKKAKSDADAKADALNLGTTGQPPTTKQEERDESTSATVVSVGEFYKAVDRDAFYEKFADAGESFGTTMVADNRILPFEKSAVALELVNAKVDDAILGGNIVSVNEEGELVEVTREQAVRHRYETRIQHTFTQRAVAAIQDGKVAATVGGTTTSGVRLPKANVLEEHDDEKVKVEKAPTAERRAALLSKTEEGRKILAQEKRNGNGN